MNKVSLIGRLTKDPELNYTKEKGTAVCKASIAVDRRTKNANGEREADFINCIAWGKTAEILAEHVNKGKRIGIEGHIQTRSYTNKEGNKVYVTEVVIDSLDIIDWANSNQPSSNMDETEAELKAMGVDITPVDDGDIPF